MEIILKEKIKKLGNIGNIIKVKNGYAKNFLIPNNKALYATPQNIELLNKQKSLLEEENNKKLQSATEVAEKINNKPFIFIRSASEAGALYGSVTSKNIVESLEKGKIIINSHQVQINEPIKTIGIYNIDIELHSDVKATIMVVVSRSKEDAEIMFKKFIDAKNKKTQMAAVATTEENKPQTEKISKENNSEESEVTKEETK